MWLAIVIAINKKSSRKESATVVSNPKQEERDRKLDELIVSVGALIAAQSNIIDLQTEVRDLKQELRDVRRNNEQIADPIIKNVQEGVYLKREEYKTFIEEDFKPVNERTANSKLVEKIVFGMIGIMSLTVFGALLTLVIISKGNG